MLERIATTCVRSWRPAARSGRRWPIPTVMMVLARAYDLPVDLHPAKVHAAVQGEGSLPWPDAADDGILRRDPRHWYLWVAGARAAVADFSRPADRVGRQVLDWLKIRSPILDRCFANAISRSIRTLGTMLAAGVPILDASGSRGPSRQLLLRTLGEVLDQVTTANGSARFLGATRCSPACWCR